MKHKHKFNEVLELVLEERKNSYKSLRTAAWEKKIAKRIFEYFEDIFIEDINDVRLNRFFSFIRFKNNGSLYSDKYIKSIYSLVKAVFKKALLKGYITINPFDYDFKRPKGNIPEAKDRLVSKEDLKALFKILPKYPKLNVIVPVLFLTGMRIGELLGLFWTDIDFTEKIIHIQRSVVDNYIELPGGEIAKRGVMLSSTKTATSIRDIPVSEQVIVLLRSWLEFRDLPENQKWKDKIELNSNLNLVFPNAQGKLTNYKTLYDNLKDILKDNNLNHCNILFHKLRHNYATDLLSAGVDIDVVSKLLGHKNIETTANVYVKVDMKPKKNAIKLQSKYLHDINIYSNIM
ncbi:site-specific integrase [Ruminococcus sp. Marseille-P6503]|uniref:tyrosine-type recombinase/integrase n=1 Tax=Ruminococcus sp. Marseille-P6503 TaxID=2364796 RepID=UPI000F528614|nr:site-specific integrase [Ruminococcus sp. Marseille-P6503]